MQIVFEGKEVLANDHWVYFIIKLNYENKQKKIQKLIAKIAGKVLFIQMGFLFYLMI